MKTIKAFFLFCILHFAFSIYSNAQIIYTDVNPDVTKTSLATIVSSYSYNLDLNNDGTIDYVLTTSTIAVCSLSPPFGKSVRSVSITPQNGNEVISNLYNFPRKLDLGDKIQSALTPWNNTYGILRYLNILCGAIPSSGNWIVGTSTDKYLGFRLHVGSNNYYAWVRLNVTVHATTASFTVKDYAYNSIPNQSILAGETSCTIPTVTLTGSGPLAFCAGDSVALTANGTGYNYQWKKGGISLAGAISQTYVAKTAGTYKCKVTNSCSGITSAGIIVSVPCKPVTPPVNRNNEIMNFSNTIQLLIFPNPASNATTISFSLNESQKVSLQVFDLNGRLIKTLADKDFEEGEHQMEWNAEEENAGIYFLKVQTAHFTKTERLIVTK